MKRDRAGAKRKPARMQQDTAASRAGCPQPRPASLGLEDDRLLLDLAHRIVDRGLTAPAVLWLESVRPLSFLGSQAMHFLNPFVQMVIPSHSFGRLAEILEERSHLERLLLHIETVAGGVGPDQSGHEP